MWGEQPLLILRALCAATALVLVFANQAFAEPQLVIKVGGPLAKRVRTGVFLSEDKPLKLGENDRIVIVDSKGARAFSGPRVISFNRKPVEMIPSNQINNLVGSNEPIVRLAGVRGVRPNRPETSRSRTNPFLHIAIRPSKMRTICFAEESNLLLERNSSEAATLIVQPLASGGAVKLSYSTSQSQHPWPSLLRPAVSARAEFRISEKGKSYTVKLIHVPISTLDWIELGRFVTNHKCSNGDWIVAMRDWDERAKANALHSVQH
jgi:hypothetical protein